MGFEQDKRRAIAVGEFEQSGPIELMHQQFFRTPPRAVIYLIAHLRRDRKPSFGHLANLFCRRTVAKSDASKHRRGDYLGPGARGRVPAARQNLTGATLGSIRSWFIFIV